jgi:hypothetical protein
VSLTISITTSYYGWIFDIWIEQNAINVNCIFLFVF